MPAFDPNVLDEELKSEEDQRRDELYTKLNTLTNEVHALRAKSETAPPGAHAHAAPGRFVS